jgi:hypothetical protein
VSDPIDYSRPVGWWCAHCEEDQPCTRAKLSIGMACKHIPRYLPIPKGQRPIVEDAPWIDDVCVTAAGAIGLGDQWTLFGEASRRWATPDGVGGWELWAMERRIGDTDNEAQAIIWVVEGVKPTGATE